MIGTVLAVVEVALGVVVVVVTTVAVDSVAPVVVNLLATLALEPLSIPTVSTVILWSQLAALLIAVAVRVGYGVKDILLDPRPDGPSFASWLLKSVGVVSMVALMPTFCTMVIDLGSSMFSTVQGWTSDSLVLASSPVGQDWVEEFAENVWDYGLFDGFVSTMAACIAGLLVAGGACMVVYQLVKREFIMLVVSVIAPWVSAKAAFDAFDDYLDLLVSLLFLCITQWVQYLFFAVAVTYLNDYTLGTSIIELDVLSEEGVKSLVIVLASLGAAMAVPGVIERYSFSGTRGGAGNQVVGTLVRGGVGVFTSLPGNAGRAAASVGARYESSSRRRGDGD